MFGPATHICLLYHRTETKFQLNARECKCAETLFVLFFHEFNHRRFIHFNKKKLEQEGGNPESLL